MSFPVLVAVVLISFCAVLLSAPTATAEDKTAAREHWERGTKFYDLGKYDDAIREFEAAYEAKGDPAFLYNLAQSHRLAGHPADALRFYRTYLRYVPKAANRSDIEDRIRELEKTIAERPAGETGATSPPSTSATTAPPSLGTTTPQNPGGGTGGAAPLQPGAPDSSATAAPGSGAPGGPPPFTAGSGATTAPPMSPGGDTSPSAPRSSVRKTVGIAVAASGAGLMVVGGIFGLVARSQSNKVESAATSGDRFDPSVESLGKTAQTLQWIGYGVGLAAVVTGLVLYATAPSQAETPPPPRVAVAPLAVPGSGGALSLSVAF